MTNGWDAKGLLKPAWDKIGGRDKLAAATGIDRGTLSGYNTGRLPLGIANARRIAEATGVTVLDLGAPAAETVSHRERRMIDRLAEVEAALETLGPDLKALAGLPERVLALEQRGQPRRRKGGTR